jgi:signal transduction histidine kinase
MRQQRAFASDASHQLRTPLTALLLRLERARELVATDPITAKQRLLSAEEEVNRLTNIVEGLLVIARAEGGTVETGLVELGTLATDRIEAWQPLCAERDVTITLESRGSTVCSAVLTAPEQVLDNYIDNALTHSPDGSHITVRISSESGLAVLEVWDEGAGLSPDDRERAFDRFWRADSTREGTGLGLAIVKHLVETSGGTAELRPRTDGRPGTIARATFPLASV